MTEKNLIEEAIPVEYDDAVHLIAHAPQGNAIMLHGEPGTGKTACMRDAALLRCAGYFGREVLGREYVRKVCFEEILSSRLPEDLVGAAFAQDIGGRKYTCFAPPSKYAPLFEPEGPPVIFFLDELPQARQHIQVLAMQIALENRIGDGYLRENINITAAGNRASDRAATNPMPKPLENRFEHYRLVVNAEKWCLWASRMGFDPIVIAYIRADHRRLLDFKPDAISKAWPTPRSWEKAHKRLQALGWTSPYAQMTVAGNIGEAHAQHLFTFRALQNELPDTDLIMKDPLNAPLPTATDRQYFVMQMLASHIFRDANLQTVTSGFLYASRLPADFGVSFMRTLLFGDPKKQAMRFIVAALSDKRIEESATEWQRIFDLVNTEMQKKQAA